MNWNTKENLKILKAHKGVLAFEKAVEGLWLSDRHLYFQ